MYTVGFLFGLGFDTATRSGFWLLPRHRRSGASFRSHDGLSHPLHGGDGAGGHSGQRNHDGSLRLGFIHPLRKLWYNMTLTALSVLVALLIGSLEALGFWPASWACGAGFRARGDLER